MRTPPRSVIFGFLIGVAVGAIPIASAATLGALNSKSLGSANSVVAACDDTIKISWQDGSTSPAYNGSATVTNSTFDVSSLAIENVDGACDGKQARMVAANGSGTALATAGGTVSLSGGAQVFPLSASVNSKNVEQVTLTIFD